MAYEHCDPGRSFCDGQSYTVPMLPSLGYQGFRTAPIPTGWVQMGERSALWWNGREVASVTRPARVATGST